MSKVVVIGSGISGLAVAYRLCHAAPAVEVVVLEKAHHVGGTIRTERQDGFQIEGGPNGFLDSKPATLHLAREVGLGEHLIAGSESASRNRYLFLRGKLRRLPDGPGALLNSDVLSWRGKWGLLTEMFRRSRPDGTDESIDAFARRRAGNEVAEVLADAFVTGIHAGDPTRLSVRATFPRLVELEQQHGSIIKGFLRAAKERRREAEARGEPYQRGGKMWSFTEGMGLLPETLSERLPHPPLTGVSVRRVEQRDEGEGPRRRWLVRGEGQDSWEADAVVLTCPAYEQASLLADLDTELAQKIAAIPYNRVAVVALGYRVTDIPISLDGFGYLVPQRDGRDLLGVQWCSSIYPKRAPDGMALLRAMCGGWGRPEMLDWSDEQLLRAVREELRLALGVQTEPVFHRIIRWERAIPQYHLGHLERVGWIEQRCANYAGLFVGGNAYRGVALNDCTERGAALAAQVADYLARAET